MRAVLVDAGPLVALLDRADPAHEACVAALKTLRDPLVTVWPAFTEAMYLLGPSWPAQKELWSRLETDALALAPLDETDAPRMRELMEKCRDLPMDLADAALVRVAERESLREIFTLDRKHAYALGRHVRIEVLQRRPQVRDQHHLARCLAPERARRSQLLVPRVDRRPPQFRGRLFDELVLRIGMWRQRRLSSFCTSS